MSKSLITYSLICLMSLLTYASTAENITIADSGKSHYRIVKPANASCAVSFACSELADYLSQIGDCRFTISDKPSDRAIYVGKADNFAAQVKQLGSITPDSDEYGVLKQDQSIYLLGGSDRAVLYAVYDFLESLGCRWYAPAFDFFGKADKHIPAKDKIIFEYNGAVCHKTDIKYRKLYIDEGLTHNKENLLQLIDWIPKARLNAIVFPISFKTVSMVVEQKVEWDRWREYLTPELKKRGIAIEVGGHGYENFLNTEMENGTLFDTHPQWFGVSSKFGDAQHAFRSSRHNTVFCTSNTEAVDYLHKNIAAYLKAHPEIDIFDFWPPDSESWCECDQCKALGTPSDRHSILVSQTATFLSKEIPKITLECLAYNRYTAPAQNTTLSDNILVDFCPYDQSYEFQIYDQQCELNKVYDTALREWQKRFNGDISIFTYYRKYIWRSLPVIIPQYMQADMQHYRKIGVKGFSVFSEPGDWFTYGLNHYVFSRLAWDPDADTDDMIEDYCEGVYGSASGTAIKVYAELEEIVRRACQLQQTSFKTAEQYDTYLTRINKCAQSVKNATMNATQREVQHLGKLSLMLEYAQKSITAMKATASKATKPRLTGRPQMSDELKQWLESHLGKGLFIKRW